MQDAQSVEKTLEEIISSVFPEGKGVQSVSIVSKTGLMVAGKAASTARVESFSAMAAVMFSAAEATKSDIFKDKIEYVLAIFRNTKLFIAELSSSLLIVITTDREMDDKRILQDMQKIVTKTKEQLVWLR